jgi:hypothetical protein
MGVAKIPLKMLKVPIKIGTTIKGGKKLKKLKRGDKNSLSKTDKLKTNPFQKMKEGHNFKLRMLDKTRVKETFSINNGSKSFYSDIFLILLIILILVITGFSYVKEK